MNKLTKKHMFGNKYVSDKLNKLLILCSDQSNLSSPIVLEVVRNKNPLKQNTHTKKKIIKRMA